MACPVCELDVPASMAECPRCRANLSLIVHVLDDIRPRRRCSFVVTSRVLRVGLTLAAGFVAGWSVRFMERAMPSHNSIHVIAPYLYEGVWVFDDDRVGLVKEPFVSGVPEIIDEVVKEIPDAKTGFVLFFSEAPFPGADVELVLTRPGELGGNWYRWTKTGQEGWLCPALFKYFKAAPATLYCQAKRK